MGKPYSITPKCWIYLEKSEERVMRDIIKALSTHKSLSINNLCKITGHAQQHIGAPLWKLIANRKVRIQQIGRNRIVRFWK